MLLSVVLRQLTTCDPWVAEIMNEYLSTFFIDDVATDVSVAAICLHFNRQAPNILDTISKTATRLLSVNGDHDKHKPLTRDSLSMLIVIPVNHVVRETS